jgi:hypothetical protein
MKDLEKMGIADTKLLHMFLTNAKFSKGISESVIKEHIFNLNLFLHWSRKAGVKYEIRSLFFCDAKPYKFLDIFMLLTSPGYSRPDTVKIPSDIEHAVNFSRIDKLWYGIFEYMGKYVPIGKLKGESFFEKTNRFRFLAHNWKAFYVNINFELEYDNTFKLNGGPLEAGQIS